MAAQLGSRRRRRARPRGGIWSWYWSRIWGRRRSCCRCWTRSAAAYWRLNCNRDGRSCLEEADRPINILRRLIAIKPEIVQCSPPKRVGVLVLPEGFAVPSYGVGRLSNSPRHATVALVIERAIVWPARFLPRRVKPNVADTHSWWQRHSKRLNAAVQVLVIQSVLIVPDSGTWVSHFITYKPDPIVARVRLDLIYCGARPS